MLKLKLKWSIREKCMSKKKNNKRLKEECAFIKEHQGELVSNIFNWQDKFNQQKSRAEEAEREQDHYKIKFKELQDKYNDQACKSKRKAKNLEMYKRENKTQRVQLE